MVTLRTYLILTVVWETGIIRTLKRKAVIVLKRELGEMGVAHLPSIYFEYTKLEV